MAVEPTRVKEVRIAGNLRVEDDAIRLQVKITEGMPFDPALVNEDVKAIYRMGFFDDVKAEHSAEGVLTYRVTERPYVREIRIQGNTQLDTDRIETTLGVRPRTILDRDNVLEGVEKVKKLYGDQGYGNAVVDFAITRVENNQAMITLDIQEGQRLLIHRISFEGNRAFTDKELKGLMATKAKWLFSFLTNRGVLDQEALTNDLAVLSAHYFDHGYINHKIDEPVTLRQGGGLELVIRVQEGEQFKVGKVELGGDLIEDPEKLLEIVELTSGQIFRGSRLRRDMDKLSERYADRGFAFARVEPVTRLDQEGKKVDVALVIQRGPPVYFNRITIGGNTKTRDKVIRRELEVTEQELFSGSRIRESRNALQRTGYFETVELSTKKTDRPGELDLEIEVKEGPTGSFGAGAGFTSGAQAFVNASVSERNLFGRGQGVSANINLGTQDQNFILSFTEPYFLDTRVSLGVDAFRSQSELSSFDSRRTGFGWRTNYPLKYLRFFNRDGMAPARAMAPMETDDPMRIGVLLNICVGGVPMRLAEIRFQASSRMPPPRSRMKKGHP